MGRGRELHPRKAKSGRLKEKGKTGDAAKFLEQLSMLDLRIVEVTADGNCFFRSLSEQLNGYEHKHHHYRQQVVDYLEAHREEFEPFVEDDVPFDEYCKTMREDGTWAGNMELQAASLVTGCNICIHRLMFPRWHIKNFDDPACGTLHLSYHDNEHYNSVRSVDDDGKATAKPISIKADASSGSRPIVAKEKGVTMKGNGSSSFDETAVRMVLTGTGCKDASRVQQVLHDVHGDVDAAIEFLIAELRYDEDPSSSNIDIGKGSSDDGCLEILIECSPAQECVASVVVDDEGPLCSKEPSSETIDTSCLEPTEGDAVEEEDSSLSRSEPTFARNKPCPCGSKKKYKACCGAIRSRSSPSGSIVSLPELTNKARREKLRAAKIAPEQTLPRRRSNLRTENYAAVDMGSLCI